MKPNGAPGNLEETSVKSYDAVTRSDEGLTESVEISTQPDESPAQASMEKANMDSIKTPKKKYSYWAIEDFDCSMFNCSGCKDCFIKNQIYQTNQLDFENGKLLGEGSFGAVTAHLFHGIEAAFKKVPMQYKKKEEKVTMKVSRNNTKQFENDKNRAIYETYKEFKIQRKMAKKPGKNNRDGYQKDDELLILAPLACFFVEDNETEDMCMILVLPKCKSDLNRMKKQNRLDEDNIREILKQLYRATQYLVKVRWIRHQDLKPNNILLNFKENKTNGKIENIKIKLTDFGLSCGDNEFKRGGTPLYSSPEAFGGRQDWVDVFSYGRITLFLALDYPDFLQLVFMPIEDKQILKTIQTGLAKFDIFEWAKMATRPGYRELKDVSKLSHLLISRSDLIASGIPQSWFSDPKYVQGSMFGSEIEDELFNLKNK